MTVKRSIAAIGVLSLSIFSVQAIADSQSFQATFSNVVCSNGWVGCIVEDEDITVDSIADSRGLVHSATARVSFFDFQPLLGHSPFDGVDQYPQVVAEEPEPLVACWP